METGGKKVIDLATERALRPSLTPIRRKFDSCKHGFITVDEGTRSVECSDCSAPLDPFDILYEYAIKERLWFEESEAYKAHTDSRIGERYDEIWAERKGDITAKPADPETLRVWEDFSKYLGDRFDGMYKLKGNLRSGPEWYARGNDGTGVSLRYVRHQLLAKVKQNV